MDEHPHDPATPDPAERWAHRVDERMHRTILGIVIGLLIVALPLLVGLMLHSLVARGVL